MIADPCPGVVAVTDEAGVIVATLDQPVTHTGRIESTHFVRPVRYRFNCTCGWVGEWQPRAGLANAEHDAHLEESDR